MAPNDRLKEATSPGRIQVLPGHVAQKIAAGEVIDRPQSLVRELVDNALDAQATSIQVGVRSGGVEELVVQDDGMGMGPDDLSLCWLPHATSKIRTENDLYQIATLGFRGEALSAIAAVARLSIQTNDGTAGSELKIAGGTAQTIRRVAAPQGTRITVQDLFYNLPARREFLKRAATETSLCQNTVIEKALSFPTVRFAFHTEGEPKLILPACSGTNLFLERLLQVYGREIQSPNLVHEVKGQTDACRIRLLLASPALFRNDRRLIQIFINNRRIQDFGLVQAIEYGFTGFLPGGRFPIAFLHLEVDPKRIDVNIHPAKREVRLRDHAAIHHRIVELTQSFLRAEAIQARPKTASAAADRPEAAPFDQAAASSSAPPTWQNASLRQLISTPQDQLPQDSRKPSADYWKPTPGQTADPPAETAAEAPPLNFRYLGQALSCFLVVEYENRLLMIDFHAAHERILFDRLIADRRSQPLLIPRDLTVTSTADHWLTQQRADLLHQGIDLEPQGGEIWHLKAAPSWLHRQESSLVAFLDSPHGDAAEILRQAAAQIACRAALKDGHRFQDQEAVNLVGQTLDLPEPRCPHGRPVWYELGQDELFSLIGRHIKAPPLNTLY